MSKSLARSRSMRLLRSSRQSVPWAQQEQHPATQQDFSSDEHRSIVDGPPSSSTSHDMFADIALPERPKTSGGPGDRTTLFHKKVTPAFKNEFHGFEFPLPSPLHQKTLLSPAHINEPEDDAIGVALGSPSASSPWNIPSSGFAPRRRSSQTVLPFTQLHNDGHKSRSSRWRSLFRRLAPVVPARQKEPFYQLSKRSPSQPTRADSHHEDDGLEPLRVAQDESIAAVSPLPKDHVAPDAAPLPSPNPQTANPPKRRLRALTLNSGQAAKKTTAFLRSMSSPQVPPKDFPKVSTSDDPPMPRPIVTAEAEKPLPIPVDEDAHIHVDIPEVDMERYSVMFSKVLRPVSTDEMPSLLQRRQANPEKLAPLTTKIDSASDNLLKPARRATSPSFTPKSPAYHLSLFPSPAISSRAPSPRPDTINRPRPRHRAKTAPLRSPLRNAFQDDRTAGTAPSSPSSSSALDQDTDSSDAESDIVPIPKTLGLSWTKKVQEEEPKWDIITKPQQHTPGSPSNDADTSRSEHPTTSALSDADKSGNPATMSAAGQSTHEDPEDTRDPATDAEEFPTLIGIAQSVFVSRTKSTKKSKSERVKVVASAGRSLIPTLIDLKDRKARRIQMVHA